MGGGPLHGRRRRVRPAAESPTLEATAVLAALATATVRLRLGPLVLGATYRHPAVVANWAATMDHVSGGRFVLGLGAGWQANEHDQYGIDLPAVRERVDRFTEYCEVVTRMLPRHRWRRGAPDVRVRRPVVPPRRRVVRAAAHPGPVAGPGRRQGRPDAAASWPATRTSGTCGACRRSSPSGPPRSTAAATPSAATRRTITRSTQALVAAHRRPGRGRAVRPGHRAPGRGGGDGGADRPGGGGVGRGGGQRGDRPRRTVGPGRTAGRGHGPVHGAGGAGVPLRRPRPEPGRTAILTTSYRGILDRGTPDRHTP